MSVPQDTLVLVTGGSGFVGSYCILALLAAGYTVRTTVRSLKREAEVREMLRSGGASSSNVDKKLSFVEADLSKDDGWSIAVKDCTYVLHVASPLPNGPPKHEDDLIIPAREGTLRILRVAKDAGVKRVVLTSSVAAIVYGQGRDKLFTEKDWTVVESNEITAYQKSKTFAEKAAWDFIEREGGGLELAAVCPAYILGPVLGADFSPSVRLIERLLKGELLGLPDLQFTYIDVRDLADLELLAMVSPNAKGQRFIAASPPSMTIKNMAKVLREKMPEAARKVPTRSVPSFLVRIVALFDREVSIVVGELGQAREMSIDKAKEMLGWNPMSDDDSIIATAESMIQHKLV